MIKFDNLELAGFSTAIRGMRNPKESWDKSDSYWGKGTLDLEDDVIQDFPYTFVLGKEDWKLAMTLVRAGSDHSKFLRQIYVGLDITAPLRFWKEFDTYKVGTTANSTSTMHKLGSRPLEAKDFSWDTISVWREGYLTHINGLIVKWRNNPTEDNFRMMIDDLLDSFIQTRTVTLNYEVLRGMYHNRKNHKQREWREFCEWIEKLPYSEFITEPREGIKQ